MAKKRCGYIYYAAAIRTQTPQPQQSTSHYETQAIKGEILDLAT